MRFSQIRSWRIFLCLVIASPILSCKTLNLDYNEEYLYCGENYPSKGKFLNIIDPNDKRIDISDLQLINVDNQVDESKQISSKGCLNIPANGRYMIRSLSREWANIFDSTDLRGQKEIKLRDYSHNNISINCESNKPLTVSPNFSLQSILLNNVESEFQEGYKLEYEVASKQSTNTMKSNIALNLVNESSRPFLLSREENLDLRLKIRNLLKNQVVMDRTCSFHIDSTPPEARLATNQGNSDSNAIIHGDNVLLVKLADSLSFVSDDKDVKEIRYCQILLNDDFEDSDLEKKSKWMKQSASHTCPDDKLKTVAPNQTIPIDEKNGIWSFAYQAVDALGNISVQKQSKILFYHKEEIELINSRATSKVMLAVQDARSYEAVQIAMDAERSRQNLATRYERNESYISSLAGLTNAYHQTGISYKFPEDLSGCGENLAVTNDGKYFICGKGNTNLVIWDISLNRIHREINITPPSIEIVTNNFALSGSGKYIATYKDTNSSILWEIESGKVIKFNNQEEIPHKINAVSREARYIVYQEDRENFAIVEVSTGVKIGQFKTDTNQFETIQFSPNNEFLVVFNRMDNFARIIDVKSSSVLKLQHVDRIESATMTPDSKRVFTASRDGIIAAWNPANGEMISSDKAVNPNASQDIRLAATNDKVLALTGNSHFTWYRIDGMRRIKEFDDISRDKIYQVRVPENSNMVYTSSNRSPIKAWFDDSGQSEKKFKINDDRIVAFLFEKDGKGFYTSSLDLMIRHWQTKTLEVDQTIPTIEYAAKHLSLTADEKSLVYISKDPSILDLEKLENLKKFPGHYKGVDSVALSHDKKLLATCSHDFSAIIWDVETQKTIHRFTNAPICARILFSPDDKIMIVNSNADIFLWDVSSGQLLNKLDKHISDIREMGLFRDGRRMFSGSVDKTIQIWDLPTGKVIQSIDTGEGISDVILSPDEKFFAVLHPISNISIWDVEKGTKLSSFGDKSISLEGFSFHPDMKKIYTYDHEGYIQIWDQTVEGLILKICSSMKPYIKHSLCGS